MKHEHLVVDILIHLQELTVGRLLTEDGAPNVAAIRSVFEGTDEDGDNFISFPELKEFLYEIRFRKSHWEKDKKLAEVMKEFDLDGDNKITMDEFVEVFTKWLDETKRTMDKQYHSVKSLKDLYKIFQPWIQNKRKEDEMKKQLMSEIIGHVQRSALGSLFTEDETPDISAVKRLFESIDLDRDNCITQEELKEVIVKINLGKIPWDEDEIVRKIMEELDVNRDQVLSEEEFTSGLLKWFNTQLAPNSTEDDHDHDLYQKKWDEIEMLVKEEKSIKKCVWAWTKAIMLLVVGIVMLALLAEPLIQSVHNFSKSANIPSFFISFMLVPLATNARGAISAIKAASRKKARTTSLAFSEIYGGVFMNNLLGFSVLLSLIYLCGLSWRFSAQLLIVLIVTAVTGFTASFNSTFPVWKSLVAYLLYPLSLLLVYVMHI